MDKNFLQVEIIKNQKIISLLEELDTLRQVIQEQREELEILKLKENDTTKRLPDR